MKLRVLLVALAAALCGVALGLVASAPAAAATAIEYGLVSTY